MERLILLTLISATFSFCQAQRLHTIYYGVSSDSLHDGHQLEFRSDTTVEISTFPRHMSQQFKMTLNYRRTGKTLKIINKNISKADSIAISNHRLKQFLNEATFTIDKKAIVDTSSKIVYVLYQDFSKTFYVTYLIDGKAYKQETGLPDAYGLVKNHPEENFALKDKIASIKNLDNYIIRVYKGLDAYKKFGYDSVFGVIELHRRN